MPAQGGRHDSSRPLAVMMAVFLLLSSVRGFGPPRVRPGFASSRGHDRLTGRGLYIDCPDSALPCVNTVELPLPRLGDNSTVATAGKVSSTLAATLTTVALPKPSALSTTPQPRVRTIRSRRSADPGKTPHIITVATPEEFDLHVRSETDKLVVVRFHARYCPACKSIAVSYDRLARKHAGKIKFVDVSVTDRMELVPFGLDVPATPYGQIYHQTYGLVEASPIPHRLFSKFKKILKWYAKGECELPEEFFTNPHSDYDLENLIL